MITKRLSALRQEMAKRDIAMYIVPTADFHESEYVGDYFKAREYMTGFTGSAGVAIITQTEAGLWTDGRYFVQAEEQLKGTEIILYKKGEDGVPDESEYVENTLKEGEHLGFDGRVINASWGKKLNDIVTKKKGAILAEEDLVGLIWEDRPKMSAEPVWILEEQYAGESVWDKIEAIRKKMDEERVDVHLISSLDDIAWILNVRGNDITYVPVVLSYLAIAKDSCTFFVQEQVIDNEVKTYLNKSGVQIKPYHSFYEYVAALNEQKVWVDSATVNYRIWSSFSEDVTLFEKENPSTMMKAVKNQVQMENNRKAHLKDAVAMCKFMYWLKNQIGKIPMSELSASDYLYQLRAEQENFLELSFETICGYADHGAIVHYAVDEDSDVELRPEGLLLVDSGGQYLEGTTDVTRTFVLGELTQQMKEDFTRVCRANINLASTRFMHGCTGLNLDIIAREPLWEAEEDYNHGTGHGVGALSNVHEGPNAFRWRNIKGHEACVLEEGMVTTDEPGIYIKGQYGIRTESELLCQKGTKNAYGQFMFFENLTYVPIDLDGILPEQMTETEKKRLNEYHKMVFDKVAPYLKAEEVDWLQKYTREI